jgi:hypothetical protein
MPLPFAPPPKESSLYQQLESTTLQTVTADQLNTIRAKMFSQGTEGLEDEYRRLILLMMASGVGSLSGPVVGGLELVEVESTAVGYKNVFTPGVGEVYQYSGGCINSIGGIDGSVTVEMDIHNTSTTARMLFIDQNTTSSSDQPLVESNPGSPIYFGYPQVLRIRTEGGFTSVNTTHNIVRVR